MIKSKLILLTISAINLRNDFRFSLQRRNANTKKKFKSHPFSITLKQGCAKHAPNTGASERKIH